MDRWVSLFPTLTEAAAAAGVTREMLRQMRRRGYVTTRDRAVRMAKAVHDSVRAAELLGVQDAGEKH